MLRRIGVGLALAGLVLTGSAAVADESADVLAVMDKAYAAILSGKPDDWKGLILPEGNVLSFRPHPDGPPGALQMRMQSNAEQIADDHSGGPKLVERWTS